MIIFFGLFFFCIIASILFYYKFFIWYCKRQCKIYIKEHFSYNYGEREYLEINNQTIVAKDNTGEVKINVSAIEKIDETEKHFFVKIKAGISLIIPKYRIQTQSDEVRAEFESL